MVGHFEKKKNENKYLVLDDVDENKEFPKKYEEVWEGVKKLKRLMVATKLNMGKITWKLGLNLMMICHWINLLELDLLTIIIRSVFSEDGKFWPQLFLDDALYE